MTFRVSDWRSDKMMSAEIMFAGVARKLDVLQDLRRAKSAPGASFWCGRVFVSGRPIIL